MGKYWGKNAVIKWGKSEIEVVSSIGFNNCKCSIKNDGIYYDAADQEGDTTEKKMTIPSSRASGKSYASLMQALAYAARGKNVLYLTSDGKKYTISSTDQEEVTMKALYNFYGLNKRTGAFLEKMVVGVIRQKEALNAVLLDNAAEITLNLGDPAECIFVLDGILDFEPIENGKD